MGLQFGKTETKPPLDSVAQEPQNTPDFHEGLIYPPSEDDVTPIEEPPEYFPIEGDQETDEDPAENIWSEKDRDDLTNLGNVITYCLKAPEFASKKFSSYVTAPLLDPHGPVPGSVRVLQQVMQNHMVRHL